MTESKKGWWDSLHPWQQFFIQIFSFFILPVYLLTLKYSDKVTPQDATFQMIAWSAGIYFFFWLKAYHHDFKDRSVAKRIERAKMLAEAGYVPPKKKEFNERTLRYLLSIFLVICTVYIINQPSYTHSWLPGLTIGAALLLAYELALILIGVGGAWWFITSTIDGLRNLSVTGAIIIGALIIAWAISSNKAKT